MSRAPVRQRGRGTSRRRAHPSLTNRTAHRRVDARTPCRIRGYKRYKYPAIMTEDNRVFRRRPPNATAEQLLELAGAGRKLCHHDLGYRSRTRTGLTPQAGDDARAVKLTAILTELLLCLDRGNGQFDADNRPQ